MITNKELVVSNHRKANIVEELHQKKFWLSPRHQRRRPQQKKPRTPRQTMRLRRCDVKRPRIDRL
jgi:hypothetical protein